MMNIKRKTTNSLADCIKNIAMQISSIYTNPTCKFQKIEKTKTKTAFYANEFVFRINIDWRNDKKC